MNKPLKDSITYINLCSNNSELEPIIHHFFSSQGYTVLSYLKESNNYVTITVNFPINKAQLLKKLDPYRKYCKSILLIIVFDKKPIELNFPWNLTEFGISDIVCVDNPCQITEHLKIHFNHYIALNKLMVIKDDINPSDIRYALSDKLN